MLAILLCASVSVANEVIHESLVVIEATRILKVNLESFEITDTKVDLPIRLDQAAVDLNTKRIAAISMDRDNKNTVYVIDPESRKILEAKTLPGSEIPDNVEYFDGHKIVYSSYPYPFTGFFNIYEFNLEQGKRSLLAEASSGHFSYRSGCFIYKTNDEEFYFVKGKYRSSVPVSGGRPALTQDCQNMYYVSPWLLGTNIEKYSFESGKINVIYRIYFGEIKKARVSTSGQYLAIRKSSDFRVEQIEVINPQNGKAIYKTKNMVPRNWFLE